MRLRAGRSKQVGVQNIEPQPVLNENLRAIDHRSSLPAVGRKQDTTPLSAQPKNKQIALLPYAQLPPQPHPPIAKNHRAAYLYP